MTLKEIALELLGKYNDSEISAINEEYCSSIDKELDDLNAEIDRYTRQIEIANMQNRGVWIPVSERLPEDGVEVWVTIKGSDVIKVESGETIEQAIDRVNRIRWVTRAYWSEEEHGWNDPTFGCPLVVQPITWMPIEKPEPYEEVQE